MKSIQKIWNKTIAYYLVMATVTVFSFSEFVLRGPFSTVAKAVDDMKIKYILMAITSFYILILLISGKKSLFKMGVFLREAKLYLIAIGSLIIITVFFQVRNGFRSFVIPEFLYLLLPLLFVILIVSADCINITRVLDNYFYVAVICFAMDAIGIFSEPIVEALSFSDSSSPLENPSSLLFVLLELYYLVRYEKRNGKSLICLILTIITLKRMAVIIAVLFFIFVPMIKNKKIPRWVFVVTIVFFCIMPFLLEIFYSSSTASYFVAHFGVDFNELTKDRYARTSYALAHLDQIKYGYGSARALLMEGYGITEDINRSLHSDLLSIYLECTFLGTLVYNVCYFLSVKKNIISFLLMTTIFVQMIFNHPVGAGTVGRWIIIYMMIVYFNYRKEVPFYREGKLKRKRIKIGKVVI